MAFDLKATRAAIGAALRTIPGLRVYDHPPGSIAPPSAVVHFEEVAYDVTMARGVDRATFVIVVAVTDNSDRAANEAIDTYGSGTGEMSVRTAVNGTLGGVVKDAHVTGAKNEGQIMVGGIEYQGASFNVEVFA